MKQELIEAPEVKQQGGATNRVLVEDKKDSRTYYLPTYIRFKVKDVDKLSIGDLEGAIQGTMLFTFFYRDIHGKSDDILPKLIDQFVGVDKPKAILLQFNQMESIELRVDKGITLKHNEEKGEVEYVIRTPFTTELEGEVFLSPFEILNLLLVMTIQTVSFDPIDGGNKKYDIKFNCMDTVMQGNLDFGTNCKLGNYALAPFFLDSRFTNSDEDPFEPTSIFDKDPQRIHFEPIADGEPPAEREMESKHQLKIRPQAQQGLSRKSLPPIEREDKGEGKKEKKKKSKLKPFQYAHFRIPMYKYPATSLIQIFIPLWLLGFINLAVFFQDAGLADRIASIATLALAYVAFIPTINESIPETPSILFVQILILIQTTATVLTLVQSIRGRDNDYAATPYKWDEDGFFIAVIILNCLTVAAVFLLFILHKLWWEKVYLTKKEPAIKEKSLQRQHWSNPACDQYFQKAMSNGTVKALQAL